MSQIDPNRPGSPVGQPPLSTRRAPVQKTSVLAVLSLVLGLLFCIPFAAPTFGLVCGIIALVLISKSDGLVKGKGLAVAGVIISALVLVAHVALAALFIVVAWPAMNLPPQLVESFIRDVAHDDFGSARTRLSAGTAAQVTDDQLATLKRRLADGYGTIQSVSLDFGGRAFASGVAPPAGGWSQTQAWQTNWRGGGGAAAVTYSGPPTPIPIKCEFSKRTVYGVMMMTVDPSARMEPPLFVDSFTLIGAQGLWSFPFKEAETQPTSQPND
ncbi:MAG: DUF4190 domain-containing protein [Planctomycetota bacterium]